jgi:hypothetical protein
MLRYAVALQSSRNGPRSASSFHVAQDIWSAIKIDSLAISGRDRHRLSPTYERQQMRNEVADRWWQLKCTSCTALTAK